MSTRLKPSSRSLPDALLHRDRETVPLEQQPLDRGSLIVGIIGTILIHLLLLFGIPASYLQLERPEHSADVRELDLVLTDEPATSELSRYVETNPNAPENEPDDTNAFSARNQQAANPELPKEMSPDQTPARDGQDNVPYEKIIAGNFEDPQQSTPARETPETAETSATSNPTRRDPLPGFEKNEPLSDDGPGSSIAPPSSRATNVPERVEGTDAESTDTLPRTLGAPVSPEQASPAPRPRLPRVTPGPVKRQPVGVSQVGQIGVNARFSQFGEYMERMVEAVSQRWYALCASRSYAETSTHVELEFKLTREGLVTNVETVDTTAQALGILLCRSAVEQGQPYGVWTEEMVRVLGEEQTITFDFHYW